jgi:hypothetical protein
MDRIRGLLLRNTRKTGARTAQILRVPPLSYGAEASPFALLSNTRKTARGQLFEGVEVPPAFAG